MKYPFRKIHLIFWLLLLFGSAVFAQEKRFIAILPFQNTGSGTGDWVARGIEEVLYDKLSNVSGVEIFEKETLSRILQKQGIRSMKNLSTKQAFLIGKETGVDVLLGGSYRLAGDQLTLNFRVISTYTGGDVFRQDYSGKLSDIFSLHARAIEDILQTLAVPLTAGEQNILETPPTKSIKAFENYCKAYIEFQKGSSMEMVASLFSRAIEIDPDYWEAQYNLGVIYYNFDKYSKALQQFKKVIERNPAFYKPYYGIGVIYYLQGQYRQAIRNFKTALKINPNHDRSLYYLGRVYVRLDSIPKALEYLDRASKLNPNYAPVQYYKGIANMKRGWYKTAVAAFKKALQLDPQNYRVHNALGECYYRLQRFDDSIYEYRKAIELHPAYSTAYFNLGNAVYKKGALEEIVNAYLDILESRYTVPQGNKDSLGLAQDLKKLKSGGEGQQEEIYREMIKDYRNALKYEPGFFEAAFNLALTYDNLGRADSAEYFYKQAIQNNPNLVRAHMRLGRLYERQHRYQEALKEFKKVVTIEPSYFAATPKLGEPYRYINIIEEVLKEYQLKYQLNPNDPETLLVLARIYASIGRLAQAEEYYTKLVKIAPENREATMALRKLRNKLKKL